MILKHRSRRCASPLNACSTRRSRSLETPTLALIITVSKALCAGANELGRRLRRSFRQIRRHGSERGRCLRHRRMTGGGERGHRQGDVASDRWQSLCMIGALVLLASGAGVTCLLTQPDAVANHPARQAPLAEPATACQASEGLLSQTDSVFPRADVFALPTPVEIRRFDGRTFVTLLEDVDSSVAPAAQVEDLSVGFEDPV